MKNGAKRPYVICHMVPSVDGRIVTTRWKLPPGALAEYERTAATFDADAWMIGRISMEPYAGKARVPARKVPHPIPRTDFIARRDAESYAIALDPSGKLTWKSSSIDEEHMITVLTEEVSCWWHPSRTVPSAPRPSSMREREGDPLATSSWSPSRSARATCSGCATS